MTEKVQNIIIYSFLCLLALGSFWFVFRYGVNVPHWDDHAIRVFVDQFKLSSFGSIFSFHNEHRIATTRIAALKTNLLLGHLDFKFMMYLGQAALLFVMASFIYLKERFNLFWVPLICLALFIFNGSTVENSLWAMASVQNHWVIAFSLISLLVLIFGQSSEKHQYFFFSLAVFISLISLFTSGNGVLVAPLGLIILLFAGEGMKMWYWLLIHSLFLIFYFIGFKTFGMNQRPHIEDFFLNLFAVAGSFSTPFLNFNLPIKIPQVLGLLNVLFAIRVFFKLLFKKGNNQKLLVYIAYVGFFIGTMVLISISRNDYERAVLLTSKYKIYSFLLLGTSLLFSYKEQLENWRKVDFLILGVSFILFANAQFSFIDDFQNTSTERTADLFNLKQKGGKYESYQPAALPFDSLTADLNAVEDIAKIDSISLSEKAVLFYENELNLQAENYVLVVGPNHRELTPFRKEHSIVRQTGYSIASLNLFNFPTDIYEIYMLEVNGSKAQLFDSKKVIRIDGVKYTEAPKNW